ncbi:MAG TPA: DNA-processing protein DprA [Candidatus Gracilibacteria bacterium]|nr:DNA-processing protein DprA [Candidatus Gracilibacteria bacterium]
MLKYWAAWASLNYLTPMRGEKLLRKYSDLAKAWENLLFEDYRYLEENLSIWEKFYNLKQKIIPEQEVAKLAKHRVSLLSYLDENYPEKLKQIFRPPFFLFYQGDLGLLNKESLAIVGTRKMGSYAKQIISQWVPELSREFVIVSGLALGVDGEVHQQCLNAKGKTIAVLGNGLDIVYPAAHRELASQIGESGGLIISEFPLGTSPLAYNFPQRNRIIAGLADKGTLVIEAQIRSGSLITARLALEQGREVYAVPGNIFQENCGGTNHLIQRGEAQAVLSVQDILGGDNLSLALDFADDLSPQEQQIWRILAEGEFTTSELVAKTQIPSSQLLPILSALEIRGKIFSLGGDYWSR